MFPLPIVEIIKHFSKISQQVIMLRKKLAPKVYEIKFKCHGAYMWFSLDVKIFQQSDFELKISKRKH